MHTEPALLLQHISDFIITHQLDGHAHLCVAVSGGADSMALAHLLMSWRKQRQQGPEIVVLHVNHGLRAEADEEEAHLRSIVEVWPNTRFVALAWQGDKPDSRIQEQARTARYALMQNWMAAHKARALFVAHHADDQAETFLIRLCAGSGLDGLAAMQIQSKADDNSFVYRPLLSFPHSVCEAYCRSLGVVWNEDPSNKNLNYQRPRLRDGRALLEAEGLSNKRLAATAERLSRAREALDQWRDDFIDRHMRDETRGVSVPYQSWIELPDDIKIRVLSALAKRLNQNSAYPPSLEKIEAIVADLKADAAFPRQSFFKLLWSRSITENRIYLERERAV